MISDEAAAIGYKSGIRELGPVVQRLINIEQELITLFRRIEALEKSRTAPHLSALEKRKAH